jgi:hypothetical protein
LGNIENGDIEKGNIWSGNIQSGDIRPGDKLPLYLIFVAFWSLCRNDSGHAG